MSEQRKKIDYSNGKIYKIVNTVNGMVYIGSTTQPLSKRMVGHRGDAKRQGYRPLYSLFNAHGVDKFKIVLLHTFPCENKEELEAEENKVMATYAKDLLLNLMQAGKHADDSKAKMSKAKKGLMGLLHNSFKRGCISDEPNAKRFKFLWQDAGKQCSRSFCFGKKRTREQAYEACWELREKKFPLSNADYLKELPTLEL